MNPLVAGADVFVGFALVKLPSSLGKCDVSAASMRLEKNLIVKLRL
jgi:hypothetical protein